MPEDRAGAVVRHLFGEGMWSGLGVHTMSWNDAAYNPIGYHIGIVWPHDNSLVSAGLYRYGYREKANRIAVAMLQASEHTNFRLPEVRRVLARGSAVPGALPHRQQPASLGHGGALPVVPAGARPGAP